MVMKLKYVSRSVIILITTLLMITFAGCSKKEVVEINISAAASLTQVVSDIVKQYEVENTGTKINLNFAGTNTLKMQIEEGADADLFLSANFKYYDELDKKGFIEEGSEFANNKLCIIKHKDNKEIERIEDITKSGLKIIVGAKEVPVGKYTLVVLDKLESKLGKDFSKNALTNVASMESDVKRIVTKINLNEGDCGFVYKTDVIDSIKENVEVIEIEDDYNVISSYYAGIIKKDNIEKETEKIYKYILSEKVKEIFKKYGFEIK